MNPDWQDPDETAFDPDNPLALLEKAAAREGMERTQQAIWALESMLAAGADQPVIEAARSYTATSKVLPLGSFDRLVRRHELDDYREQRDTGRGPSVATQLVGIARELYDFGTSDLGEPFALPKAGPKVVAMLRGSKTSLRALLAREYFTRTGAAATQQALADALLVIEGIAQEREPSRLYLRAAQHDGALWLDLGDQAGRAIEVTSRGWSVEDEAPVLFKRTALTAPLPEPRHGGSLEDLWERLNVAGDDRPLVAADLVATLFSDQPHVILAIFGEQGTGKTTAVKILTLILDPSPVPVRKPPRDADTWVTAAAGSWVVGLDNLSDIPTWLSDSLCRASTGDGDVRRKLYSDNEYAVFAFRRCIIFDAIDVGALAPDLADRTLAITLDLIPDKDRRAEETFWAEWQAAHPKILGAVLSLASKVLRRLPGTSLEKTPRMADYARILAAVDAELGTSALDRYARQAVNLAAEGLSGDSLASRIQEVITAGFEGTSAKLLELVKPKPAPDGTEPKLPKDWPASSRAVTSSMRRLAPAFRKTGWHVSELPPGHDNAIRWKISPPVQTETSREDAREPSQDSHDGPGASDASEREPVSGTSPSGGQETLPGRCEFRGCKAPARTYQDGTYCDPHAEKIGARS